MSGDEKVIDVKAETVNTEAIGNQQVQKKQESFFREVFGQFTQPVFWRDLTRLIVSEMVSSFLMALGGSLLWYGKQRKDSKVSEMSNSVNTSSVANKAFGNSYTPNNSYRPSEPSYNMPSTFNQNNSFPGFPTR